METGWCDYGGHEVPWFAVCKVENQECLRFNSISVQRPDNLGNQGYNSWSKNRGLRNGVRGSLCKIWSLKAKEPGVQCLSVEEDGCLSSKEQSELAFPASFGSIWALNKLDDAHPQCWGQVIFIQSPDSNTSIFWKHLHRHTQELFHWPSRCPKASQVDTYY
jgi:uncharacterized protein (DUF2237 family)